MSVNQRRIRPRGSGGPRHVEEECYSSFVTQRGPISQLVVFSEKKRWGEGGGEGEGNHPLPKRPEQQYSVSALQDGSVAPIKGNVTRG